MGEDDMECQRRGVPLAAHPREVRKEMESKLG